MLKLLNIANLAVMDSLGIEFQKGLNLLTGETGSGKSIIVDALSTLFGDRFTSDKVRSGERRAWVEGVFQIEARKDLSERLDRMGLVADGDELILKREWIMGGKVRSFVNHAVAGSAALKMLRDHLIEIHGQGEEQALLSASSHLELLDRFAELLPLREEVMNRAARSAELRKEMARLRTDQSERLRAIDLLKFQVDEIDRARLRPGEEGELEGERRILSQAEKATRLAAESYALLYEQDGSVYSQLAAIHRRLVALAQIDQGLGPAAEQADRLTSLLREIADQLRDYGSGRDFSPERLAQVEDRLAELDRLKRKYGTELEHVLAERGRMAAELAELAGRDDRIEAIAREMEHLDCEYRRVAEKLSIERKRAVPRLETAIRKELDQLALRGTPFEVRMRPVDEEVSPRGLEDVEFMIAPNVGEGLRPLARIASGGELSRLMLALRTVIADTTSKCLVFDEVDTGIGGRAAEEVGLRLKRLAQTHQVFCVTHQPQIARFADAHYRVSKVVDEGRTRVVVEQLDDEGRLQELSRMLAGTEVTTAARRHAKELMKTD